MINKLLYLYVKQIKAKTNIVDKNNRSLTRILKKIRTEKYKKCWIKKSKTGALVNRKANITNMFSSKELVFIKTQSHSERYNYFLRQFLSPGIYEHFNFSLKNLFSVSTSRKLDRSFGYNRFNNKRLSLDYDIFIVLGKKVVGVLKIVFVQNLKSTRPIKYFYNSTYDITENSTLICDDNKVTGYIKYIVKPIHVALRSSHPLNDVTQLQLLSSNTFTKGSSQLRTSSFSTFMKLSFKARKKREVRFLNRIKSRYLEAFGPVDNKLISKQYSKSSTAGAALFRKVHKMKDHTNFVSSRVYRFVLHLYWKYLISESNIFMLQAYLRERSFSRQLKKFKILDFRYVNRHIKNPSTLAQLQPTLEKLIPNKDAFTTWIRKNKAVLVSSMLQNFKWVRLAVNFFMHFKTDVSYRHFRKIKNMLLLYQRNNHSVRSYYINVWTREFKNSMKSRLTLEDMYSVIKLQSAANYDVPDIYTSWDLSEQATIDDILHFKDSKCLYSYLDDRFILQHFENKLDSLSTNPQNSTKNRENLWILWSMRYINRLQKTSFLALYYPRFMYESGTVDVESPRTGKLASPSMLNSNLQKPYNGINKITNSSHVFNFNMAPQFAPQSNVSLFLKKLFKNKDFNLQHVLSPSFLHTPYLGVDFSEGFDPKFHTNPNTSISNYFKKGHIRKHYIDTSNYTYKPCNSSNLRAASLCLSVLHEKSNIDEAYLDDLFSFKTPVKLEKKAVKEFRRLPSLKSKKVLKTKLLAANPAAVDSPQPLTTPEKLNLTLSYGTDSVVNSGRSYNVGFNKLVTIEEFMMTPDDAWNTIMRFDKSRWPGRTSPADKFNYPAWHDRTWAADNIWNFTTKLSKKLWLNLLGFYELLESGVGDHQLKECLELVFVQGDVDINSPPTKALNLNFENNLANPVEHSDQVKWWSLVHSFTSYHTQKFFLMSKQNWKKHFRLGRYSQLKKFNAIFFSRFLYSSSPHRAPSKKKDILRSSSNVAKWGQDRNFARVTGANRRFDIKKLQARGVKMFMGVYTICILYNSLARRFLPSFAGTVLRENSKFLIKNQPALVIKPKPISFKLLFNFKKHYLYITLLDEKNKIIFSLHTGLFLKFFEYKKSLKKSKSLKILLVRYLRKLLLLSSVRTFTLYIKQTSNQLNKLLQILQKPINHPFTDPLTGLVINEELAKSRRARRSRFFNFLYIVFFKNKPYGIMKTKKTGRLKRKIRRLVIKANRIID